MVGSTKGSGIWKSSCSWENWTFLSLEIQLWLWSSQRWWCKDQSRWRLSPEDRQGFLLCWAQYEHWWRKYPAKASEHVFFFFPHKESIHDINTRSHIIRRAWKCLKGGRNNENFFVADKTVFVLPFIYPNLLSSLKKYFRNFLPLMDKEDFGENLSYLIPCFGSH